ncbi:glycosyltransferase family 2 protein [Frankia sp. ACN1ag]|uniref:glycosyltransferase family 2 protein n=1 Tax=Frankia sp. ACN1ag TaxID=102891 RepID=UPI0009F9E8AC|nr:glycosyltransferase [Frankia sp. ACN1ag]
MAESSGAGRLRAGLPARLLTRGSTVRAGVRVASGSNAGSFEDLGDTVGAELEGEARPLRVSVVICAYTERRWSDITVAVGSVFAQTLPAFETILVIDHNDSLLDHARGEFSGIRVIPNRGARGLSGARNTGADAATGDIVAFLDDDARAREDWLEHLVSPYSRSEVQGVGGAVVPRWSSHRPLWFPAEFDWVVGCSYTGLPLSLAEIRNPIGAAMSVRRDVFGRVGGFTDGLGRIGSVPLGCEETEFYIRLRSSIVGAVVLYNPEAVVEHRVTEERASLRYFFRRCYSEGLSKAAVAQRVGQESALQAERSYVRRTLPRAFWRGLQGSATWSQSAAVASGLVVTSAGYLSGWFAVYRGTKRSRGES